METFQHAIQNAMGENMKDVSEVQKMSYKNHVLQKKKPETDYTKKEFKFYREKGMNDSDISEEEIKDEAVLRVYKEPQTMMAKFQSRSRN